jgi:predicted nucleic acid-binding protein
MAEARSRTRKRRRRTREQRRRYTIDASVFVNAFNPHEKGHAASLQLLADLQQGSDPIIVPTLCLPEIASAVSRASGDAAGALQYVSATMALPHLTLVTLTTAMARQAAELAVQHRLRGADAVYLATARRYGTTLVSRDDEQLARGSAVTACRTPEAELGDR